VLRLCTWADGQATGGSRQVIWPRLLARILAPLVPGSGLYLAGAAMM
jgi:hypothetical protein